MQSSRFSIAAPFAALFCSLTISGCMSQQIANTRDIDAAVDQRASKTEQTPQQLCEAASVAISQAHQAELQRYAPLHLEQANDSLSDGQKAIKSSDGLKIEAGARHCIKASQLIESGVQTAKRVKQALTDSIDQLAMLKQVDSQKKFADDIIDYEEDLVDLAETIEAGKMDQAMKDQADLLEDMQELEIEIVTYNHLTPVEVMLNKAEDADADDLAEKTFAKAEQELETAKKMIRGSYRDKAKVEKNSALAMRAARHAYYVAQEVEKTRELKPAAAEERVLYFEYLLQRINEKFQQDVVIGHSLYEQSSLIGERVDKAKQR
jgi:hypothetical protein